MVRRTDEHKTIVMSIATYELFMKHQEYMENREGILLKLMSKADLYDKITHKEKHHADKK